MLCRFEQVQGVDSCNTFALVMEFYTARVLLGVAAALDRDTRNLDAKAAVLLRNLDEEIYDIPSQVGQPANRKSRMLAYIGLSSEAGHLGLEPVSENAKKTTTDRETWATNKMSNG